MLAKQASRRLLHFLHIQGLIHPPCTMSVQGGTHLLIQYQITVAAGTCRKACMKFAIDLFRPADVDVVGKVAVGAEYPTAVAALGVRVDVYDLPFGMYAGVGAPGTGRFDTLVCYFR